MFGSMWMKSLYQVTFYNSLFDVFEFKETISSQVHYLDHSMDASKMVVKYEFELDSVVYVNEVTANREAFEQKVGINKSQFIYYNSLLPQANYLKNWKLDTYYNMMFIMFSIFLFLILYFHLRVDKIRWIRRYKGALNS
mgnify:FL=1|jgi:uncharacterized membrane protein YciS (DUF1049 family)